MSAAGAGSRARVQKLDPAPGAGPFGLAVFLISLAVLFIASLVAYFAVRATAEVWPPPGLPPLPRTLALSTLLLLVSSGTMHAALVAARADHQPRLRGAMVATTALGLGFLASQAYTWAELIAGGVRPSGSLFGWTFFMLTALHAAHVVGGVIPLIVTTAQAFRGRYGPQRSTGVLMCGMYWHFLDGVWLVIVGVLAFS